MPKHSLDVDQRAELRVADGVICGRGVAWRREELGRLVSWVHDRFGVTVSTRTILRLLDQAADDRTDRLHAQHPDPTVWAVTVDGRVAVVVEWFGVGRAQLDLWLCGAPSDLRRIAHGILAAVKREEQRAESSHSEQRA